MQTAEQNVKQYRDILATKLSTIHFAIQGTENSNTYLLADLLIFILTRLVGVISNSAYWCIPSTCPMDAPCDARYNSSICSFFAEINVHEL
ncbi:hypothetical protein ACROYT_G009545 [Oculina patagonica]